MEVFLSPPFYRWEHWRLNLIFFSSGSPCPDSSLPSSFSHLAHTANSDPTPRSALTVPPTGQHNYVHNGRQPHDGWLSSGLSDALKLFVSCWVRDSMCVWKISVWTIWQYLVSRRLYQPYPLTDSLTDTQSLWEEASSPELLPFARQVLRWLLLHLRVRVVPGISVIQLRTPGLEQWDDLPVATLIRMGRAQVCLWSIRKLAQTLYCGLNLPKLTYPIFLYKVLYHA